MLIRATLTLNKMDELVVKTKLVKSSVTGPRKSRCFNVSNVSTWSFCVPDPLPLVVMPAWSIVAGSSGTGSEVYQ